MALLSFLRISKDMSKSTKESVDNLSDHDPLHMLLECTIVDVSPEQDVILKEKPIWNLAKEKDILEYQDKLNELLHQIDYLNDMKLCNKCNVMCLMKGRITDFHDKIIVLYCIVLYCIMRPYTDGPIG